MEVEALKDSIEENEERLNSHDAKIGKLEASNKKTKSF